MYGQIIKRLRIERNMSLREFGKLVDLGFSYISCLEKETKTGIKKLSPSIDVLKQICDRCGYSFRRFLEEANYIEPIEIE